MSHHTTPYIKSAFAVGRALQSVQMALLSRELCFCLLPVVRDISGYKEVGFALQAAIANAATLDEVAQLEDALRTGHMPSQLAEAVNGGVTAMDEA